MIDGIQKWMMMYGWKGTSPYQTFNASWIHVPPNSLPAYRRCACAICLDSEFEHKDPDPGNFVTSEDEGVRLKWTAFLEFTQNQDVGDMTWDKVITNQVTVFAMCIACCIQSLHCVSGNKILQYHQWMRLL